MELDPDVFMVAVYCVTDDLYQRHFAHLKPRRHGPEPVFSDSEVLTLALLAQWHPSRSERAFLRYARWHWRGYFPRLPSQSELNRRMRDLTGVLIRLGPLISQRVEEMFGEGDGLYEVMDAVPVPLMRKCRGDRHRLFAMEASIGRGGSDKDWYYGVRLLAPISCKGTITGFTVGRADTEERWLAEGLFRWRCDPVAPPPTAEQLAPILGPAHRRRGKRIGPEGPVWPRSGAGRAADRPYLGDLGFAGKEWCPHWREHYGATVLTKADYAAILSPTDRRQAERWLSGLRQAVETVFHFLTEYFGLSYPRARTFWGLQTRIAAKIAAFNMLVLINYLFGRNPWRRFSPFG